jgi:hemerythrin-like domain-containing protein
LDQLFGRFLAAAETNQAAALEAISAFDDALRRHMDLEESDLYRRVAGRKLAAAGEETDGQQRDRELLLEHVQIREVSGMMRRLLAERRDLPGARALAANLARRWDAHTTREEREVFPRL